MKSTKLGCQDMQVRPIEMLMSVEALAKLLATTRRTINRMRSSGRLPGPDLYVGKMPRWKPETIRRWIDQQRGVRRAAE